MNLLVLFPKFVSVLMIEELLHKIVLEWILEGRYETQLTFTLQNLPVKNYSIAL